MANKIVEIQFEASGDEKLIKAIDKLNAVSKKLIQTQEKLHNTEKKSNNSKAKQAQALHKNFIAIQKLRLSVTKLDSNFTNAKVSTETLTQALHGNKNAMALLKLQTSRHIAEIKKYNQSLKNGLAPAEKFQQQIRQTGASTRILGGTMAVLRSKLLIFNFVMGLGVRQLSRFVEESAKLDAMETAFNTLSGGGKKASVAIDKLTNATDGTVSQMDLFQQANNAMVLGITKNSDEMAVMFDMAQRLGEALGRDARSSIESFVTGVGRQSRMMLDNIGIIVKTDEAYEIHAETLKKNVDDLTVLERKQAFLNATMEAAKEKVAGLPPEVENARRKFQRMSAEIDNATARIGEHFTPLAKDLAEQLTKLAKAVDTKSLNQLGIAVTGVAGAWLTYKTAIIATNIVMAKLAFTTAMATGGLTVLSGVLVATAAKYSGLFDTPNKDIQDLIDLKEQLIDELDILQTENEVTAVSTDVLTEAQKKAKEQLKETITSVEDEIRSLKLKRAALMGLSDFEIMKLKLGKEFVQNQPKVIAMLEKEFEAIKKLEKENEEKEQAKKDEIQAIKDGIKAKKQEIRDEEKLQKDKKRALDTIFADNQKHQFDMLEDQARYFKSILDGAEQEAQVDIWLAKQKEEIKKKSNEKIEALNKEHQDKLSNARKIVFEDNAQFQLAELEIQRKQYEQLLTSKEDEIAIEKWFQDQKREIAIKNLEDNIAGFSAAEDAYDTFVNSMLDKDLTMLEREKAMWNAFKESMFKFLAEILKEKIKQLIAEQALQKAQNKVTETEAMKNSAKITALYSPAALAKSLAKGVPYVIGVTAAVAAFQAAQKFEQGGVVGGKRHSQGGTLIEAEQGEFVMSRNAVESIGIDNLARMNQGGNAGVTININGNMIGNESFVRDTLIPEINKTVNEGLA